MTDEMITLARRAVACEGWRWMPRMAGIMGDEEITVLGLTGGATWLNQTRVRLVIYQHRHPYITIHHKINVVDDDWVIPDLTAPATLGCLLALVRAARGDPGYRPWPLEHDPGVVEWVIEAPSATRQTIYSTEAAALVAALAKKETK